MANLIDWFSSLGLTDNNAVLSASALAFLVVIFLSWLVYFVLNRVILSLLRKLAHRTQATWDNILFEKKVFKRLSHLVPAIIIHYGVTFALADYPAAVKVLQSATYLYMAIAAILVVDAIINIPYSYKNRDN